MAILTCDNSLTGRTLIELTEPKGMARKMLCVIKVPDGTVNCMQEISDGLKIGSLGSISTNKASRGDGIPVELFQILEDDAVEVLHSICQQIWKTQQWVQDWKRSVFIPIPKKGNPQECSNYRRIAVISHASKVILKIL